MNGILLLEQSLNGLQFGLMLFLLAAGLTLVFGIMDMINLAHGSLYMWGPTALRRLRLPRVLSGWVWRAGALRGGGLGTLWGGGFFAGMMVVDNFCQGLVTSPFFCI